MSMNEHCGNCRFFGINRIASDTGYCRAHPPSIIVLPATQDTVASDETRYPDVSPYGWCGEWQAKRPAGFIEK